MKKILLVASIAALGLSARAQLVVSSLGPSNTPCDDAVLTSTSVNQMVSIRVNWKDLEPNAPINGVRTFDWSDFLDGEIKRVTNHNKQIYLRIIVQADNAPGWLYQNKAGTVLQFTSSAGGHAIWVPWDPVAMPLMEGLITAAGQRYGNNYAITMVSAMGLTDDTGDWSFPHTTQDCSTWVSPAYGYTSARAVQAVQSYISTVSAAFPYAVMSMACGRNGNLDPTSGGVLPTNPDGDYDCEQIIQASMPLYGDRFCIQKNSLATFSGKKSSPADFFLILSEFNGQLQENMQALWFVYGDTSYRDNGGVPAGYGSILSTMLQDTLTWQSPDPVGFRESVIELYQTDVENLPGTIKKYSQ